MVSLMENRAAVGLRTIYESQRILKSCKREVLVYAIVYILPRGNAMYLSTLKKKK